MNEQGPKGSVERIVLPDLSEPEQYKTREATIETPLNIEGTDYLLRTTFERYHEVSRGQKSQLHLELFDPNTDERRAVWKGALSSQEDGQKRVFKEIEPHSFWRIFTRRVEKDERQKGVGTAMLKTFEDLVVQMGSTYPDLKAEWIQLDTHLSSMTKMTISQTWLKEHGLDRFCKTSGPDFGYIPLPVDEKSVEWVLSQKTEELEDVGPQKAEVTLYKPLK